MTTPKTMKVTYTVKSKQPTVKVRAVAWKDGKRSFANIVPVRTGEGIPKGESVATNEEHTFVWDVASDWKTDLDKVAVEILVQEGKFLPQELVTIPATETHKAMTVTRNTLPEPWIITALVWCYAEEDPALTLKPVSYNHDGETCYATTVYVNNIHYIWAEESGQWFEGEHSPYPTDDEYAALLNHLYGKMGYRVLTDEEADYVRKALRLDLPEKGLAQVSVKIEEE